MEYSNWKNVPSNLKSKSYCNQNRLIIKGVEPVAKVYQKINRKWIDLYDINSLEPKPVLTKEQILAKEKAESTKKERYTCKLCRQYSVKNVSRATKLCRQCYNVLETHLYELEQSNKALLERLKWNENKEQYLILDTETTGLSYDDEIVEIAIVDLNGCCLYQSLVKPTKPISVGASKVNGILDDDVANAPSMKDIYHELDRLLLGKTILAYNAEFDSSMILQSFEKHEIDVKAKYKYQCVMRNEMQIQGSDRWISLANACGIDRGMQEHRAIEDCLLVKELITDTDWIYAKLQENSELIEKLTAELKP